MAAARDEPASPRSTTGVLGHRFHAVRTAQLTGVEGVALAVVVEVVVVGLEGA